MPITLSPSPSPSPSAAPAPAAPSPSAPAPSPSAPAPAPAPEPEPAAVPESLSSRSGIFPASLQDGLDGGSAFFLAPTQSASHPDLASKDTISAEASTGTLHKSNKSFQPILTTHPCSAVSVIDGQFKCHNPVHGQVGSITFGREVKTVLVTSEHPSMAGKKLATWVAADGDRTNRTALATAVVAIIRIERILDMLKPENQEELLTKLADLKKLLNSSLNALEDTITVELGKIFPNDQSRASERSQHKAHKYNIGELVDCLNSSSGDTESGDTENQLGQIFPKDTKKAESRSVLGQLEDSSGVTQRNLHMQYLGTFFEELDDFLSSNASLKTQLQNVVFQSRVPASDVGDLVSSVFPKEDIKEMIKAIEGGNDDLKQETRDKLFKFVEHSDLKHQHLLDTFTTLSHLEKIGMIKDLILADFKNTEQLYSALLIYKALGINVPVRILFEDIEDVKNAEAILDQIKKDLGWDDEMLKKHVRLMFAKSDTSLRGGIAALIHTEIVAERLIKRGFDVQFGTGSTPQRGYRPEGDLVTPDSKTIQPGASASINFSELYKDTSDVSAVFDDNEVNDRITKRLEDYIAEELSPDYANQIGSKGKLPSNDIIKLLNDKALIDIISLAQKRKNGSRFSPKDWDEFSRLTDLRAITASLISDLLGIGFHAILNLKKMCDSSLETSAFINADTYKSNKFVRLLFDSIEDVLDSFSIQRLRVLLGGDEANPAVLEKLDNFKQDFEIVRNYFKDITGRELKPSEDKSKLMDIQTNALEKFRKIHHKFLSGSTKKSEDFNKEANICFDEFIVSLKASFSGTLNLLIEKQIEKLEAYREDYLKTDDTSVENRLIKVLQAILIPNDTTLFKIG